MEAFIIALVTIIGFSFVFEMIFAQPGWKSINWINTDTGEAALALYR
jgi:uncharacterized membrane protein YjfL (UPF0719 family)